MKVIALTASWCKKCEEAKIELQPYFEDIKWLDVEVNKEGVDLAKRLNVRYVPLFIAGDENTLHLFSMTNSYLMVKRLFETYKDK